MPPPHSLRGLVPLLLFLLLLALSETCAGDINRFEVLKDLSPVRNSTNASTPLQVGNGNFAFNADITGLQTVQPFNILSSWGWHNSSLPRAGLADTADPDTARWLAANPHRINLGRIGLLWLGREIREADLEDATQTLNLSSGIIDSSFVLNGSTVIVRTAVHPLFDTVSCFVSSDNLQNQSLTLFMDFPYPNAEKKFEAPFVGNWNASDRHKTTMTAWAENGEIRHDIDATTYYASFAIDGKGENATMVRQSAASHRYFVRMPQSTEMQLSVTYGLKTGAVTPRWDTVKTASAEWWSNYWQSGAFLDCTLTNDTRAAELQRRVVLSQYLQAVNSAGSDPPPDSGLVNNSNYGKFRLDMVYWHLAHWTRWAKWDQLRSQIPYVYDRFVQSSQRRASAQGFAGARWGELSDPASATRSETTAAQAAAPLIWQQPHPFLLAELEYRAFPTAQTLRKWERVLTQTELFMTSYPHWNASTKAYDLGPPLLSASADSDPAQTRNPTFELAYWRFGLDIAAKWHQRQNQPVPPNITHVYDNLAPFPVRDGSYVDTPDAVDPWGAASPASSHAPMLLAINGMLPPDPRLSGTVFEVTVGNMRRVWNATRAEEGWAFPLLAMTAARMGEGDKAVEWLVHERFGFDDVGMPVLGGWNASTMGRGMGAGAARPDMASGGGLLMAVAMLADGTGQERRGRWPTGWNCQAEGFAAGL